MKRRFVTRAEIDRAADAGQEVLEVDGRVTVTDLAREHAMQRGVRVVVTGAPAAGAARGESAVPDRGAGPDADAAELAAQVRRAVVAQLGHAPDGLDAVIARVVAGGSSSR